MIFRFSTLFFLCAVWIMAIFSGKAGASDPDFWWHVAYGRWMLENGTIPTVDSFSWTFFGQPYQLTQWLGEYVMGAAFLNFGFRGTLIIGVLLSGLTIFFSWKAAERFVHPAMAVVIAVAVNTIQFVTPMRPQLFSFLFVAIWMFLITGYLKERRNGYLWLAVPLMAVWVNMHGGFVVGLLLLGILASGLTVEAFMAAGDSRRVHLSGLQVPWLVVLSATLGACLNPYGAAAITNVFVIGALQSSNVISEWQPVSLGSTIGAFYLAAAIPFIAGAILGGRARLTVWLLGGFLVVFGAMANRQVAILAAGIAPLIAIILAETPAYKKMFSQLGDPCRPLAHGLTMALLVGAFFPLHALGMSSVEKGAVERDPVLAADFLLGNNLSSRLLCDSAEANYLIWRKIPVFIDGRVDLYGDSFFFEYLTAARGNGNWENLVEKHRPTAMLLRNEVALRQIALAAGWRVVFADSSYSVLVPKGARTDLATTATPVARFFDGAGNMIRRFRP